MNYIHQQHKKNLISFLWYDYLEPNWPSKVMRGVDDVGAYWYQEMVYVGYMDNFVPSQLIPIIAINCVMGSIECFFDFRSDLRHNTTFDLSRIMVDMRHDIPEGMII